MDIQGKVSVALLAISLLHPSPFSLEYYHCSEPPKNATDVAERYHNVFWMDDGRPASPDGFNSQRHSLKCDAHRRQDMLERLKSWNSDRKTLLLSMRDNLPELAIWDMYALSGQSVLEDMSGLATLDIFPWKHCGTSGHRQFTSSARISQPDVSKYLWETAPIPSSDGVPAGGDTAHPRRSERLKGRPSARSLPQVPSKNKSARSFKVKEPATPKIAVPKSARGTSRYKTNAADFIQRAWTRDVHSDSTFIIFDGGELPQDRHTTQKKKKTQTLYISELTDVRDCSNPPFGKLTVAINAAILRDAVDRAPLLDPTLIKGKRLHAGKSHKRQRDTTEATVPVRRSRRRLGETPNETALEEMKHKLLTRNISLLYLQHGNYHSNSPSFFRRPNSLGRQRLYRYDDCLTLLVGKNLREGSIEQVVRGSGLGGYALWKGSALSRRGYR
ncbi:hypothetical protein IW262DRAFT_481713 [Armillaria fumosa]|nr:hypothetical protein IW262DRAFT_481713 [Armillaria fumosa]